jgi:glycyl-tRNA synthetase
MGDQNLQAVDGNVDIDDILAKIALSRGIFFPSAEIFGENISGVWDYGPLGLKIFNNILREWRETLYAMDAVEISGGVILPKKVLQASGHEANFFDVAAVCDKCGTAYRVDKLLEETDPSRSYEGLSDEDYLDRIKVYGLRCKKCGGNLNKIKKFGSMFGLEVGVQKNDGKEANAYLRPEACQSIFLDFKRLFMLYGKHLPFTIGQVGKAFRNEISPRNGLLRQREFYQNDIEIFFSNDSDFSTFKDARIIIFDKEDQNVSDLMISEALKKGIIENSVTAYALSEVADLLNRLGFKSEDVRFRKLYADKAFYSKESFDVEIKKGRDWVEVMACNHRGDHDLSSYEKYGSSSVKIEGAIPKIFEISAGTDRLFYMALYNSLKFDGERRWISLNGRLTPFKAAVFPLLTKDELRKFVSDHIKTSKYSREIYFLDSGNIGKMYRKADEVGIPIAITVDYQSLQDNTVTLRDRDSMGQFRFNVNELDSLINESSTTGFSHLKEKFEAH